jgi:hypothetical protein
MTNKLNKSALLNTWKFNTKLINIQYMGESGQAVT